MSGKLRILVALGLLGVIAAVSTVIYLASIKDPPIDEPDGEVTRAAETTLTETLDIGRPSYVSSNACQECHAEEFSSWHDSYHRTMTQWATPESVVAPFDVTLESRGRSYKLERRGDEYWVTMLDPQLDQLVSARGLDQEAVSNLPTEAQRVVMTTGSHVAQTYWVETESGIQHVPWMYHIPEGKWIPNEDSFLVPPTEHRFFYQWNGACAKCHSVGVMPGFKNDGYETRVAELGIACEACHGPGEAHIEYRRDSANASKRAALLDQDPIVNPARMSHQQSSQVCAQCHSSYREGDMAGWFQDGSKFRPGQDLEEFVVFHHYGSRETTEDYGTGHWMDGTSRTGGDEFLGMSQSACYQKGEMSCLSCHSLHDYASNADQLKQDLTTDESCLQCHESMRSDIQAHTHHALDSTGSRCVNCHMPHMTYALFKGIRSHRIDSPRVSVTAETGRPNACNLCHVDQSLGWTGEKLTEWYGQPPVELDEQQQTLSNTVIMALKGDAAQRVIAAYGLGWAPATETSGRNWQAPILAHLLDDPYSVVRYVSYLSLKKLPGFENFEYDFLEDSPQRKEAIERALDHWQAQGKIAEPQDHASILLDENGKLKSDLVKTLLGQRDDRMIIIPE